MTCIFYSELNPDLLIQLIWYIVAFYCQLIETQCMVGDMLECDIQCPKELHLECRAELVLA